MAGVSTAPSAERRSGMATARDSHHRGRRVRWVVDCARAMAGLHPLRRQPLELFSELPNAAGPQLWATAGHLLQRLGTTYLTAQTSLTHQSMQVVKAIITQGIEGAALASAETDATRRVTSILRTCHDDVVAYVDAQRELTARRRYARGLLAGVLASLALLTVIAVVSPFVVTTFLRLTGAHGSSRDVLDLGTYVALRDSLVCIGGGAAGAAVSVMLRLSRMPIGRVSNGRGAAHLRIVLGWFFAMALLALVKGGLVAVFVDPSAALMTGTGEPARWVSSWFMWAGVGFLAGFNERWAETLFTRSSAGRGDPGRTSADSGEDGADSWQELVPDQQRRSINSSNSRARMRQGGSESH